MMELALLWGGILSAGFTLAVLGMLFSGGPEAIRGRDGTLRRTSLPLAAARVLLVTLLFLLPLVLLNRAFLEGEPRPDAWTQMAFTYLAFQLFNVYDLLVLDTLLLRFVLPRWIDFPKTPYFTTFRPHAMSFLKGCLAGIPISAIAVALSRGFS